LKNINELNTDCHEKVIVHFTFIAGVALSGCSPSQEPTKDEVLQILNKELEYPRVVDYDIFCSDPQLVNKLLKA
jgi:hypothetical protein